MLQNIKEKFPLLGLLGAQFTGAFNDNAWKLMVFTLATRPLLQRSVEESVDIAQSSQFLATLSLIVFLIPFLIFSIPAGLISDRISKKKILVTMKAVEVVLMGLAVVSIWLMPLNLTLPFVLLALMGVHSALFGPAKYGILPEILPPSDLSKGNGISEMWTMLAIIFGTGLGPLLMFLDQEGMRPSLSWTGPAALFFLSALGFLFSFAIPSVKPALQGSEHKLFEPILEGWRSLKKDRALRLAVVGSVIYWSITSLIGQNVLVYAKQIAVNFERGEILQGVAPAAYGVGIAFGALLAGKLSGSRIEYGLIPLGSVCFALTTFLLGALQPAIIGTILILSVIGLSAGMLVVPLHAVLQLRSPNDSRGAIIAMGNIFDIVGMILGSLLAGGMAFLGLDMSVMLMLSSLIVLLGTIWAMKVLPDAFVRFCFVALTKTFYRLRAFGLQDLPKESPYFLHHSDGLTLLDALLISALIDRPVKIFLSESHLDKFWMRPFAKLLRVITIADDKEIGKKLKALQKLGDSTEPLPPRAILLQKGLDVQLVEAECGWKQVPVQLEYVRDSLIVEKWGRFLATCPQLIPYKATVQFEA